MEDRIIVDCILKDGKKNLFSLIVKNYGGMVFSRAIGITKNTGINYHCSLSLLKTLLPQVGLSVMFQNI